MLAAKHPNEDQRLKTLRSYDILDTDAEASFDDIVALASRICEVPVSLISLVDSDRQWFKASVGFDRAETTLTESVCAHAILNDGVFEIEDMSKDARTLDNPLHVDDPNVQFYAGANLVSPDGSPIGTLCVLDTKPRVLTDFQRDALRTLSRQIVTELELRKKVRQEIDLRSEIDHRVSNSLQTISSLLRMGARQVTDTAALDVLGMLERRISAVASLHSELMERDGKGTVNAQSYLDRVASFLQEICPAHIQVACESVDVDLTPSAASALGMISSEFVANSIKYAFPDDRDGIVQIILHDSDDNKLVFNCKDNGIGAAQSDQKQDVGSSGLGASLMSSAAMQLGGQLTHQVGDNGALLSIVFDRPE
ncbi:histidine kinase dimerization/phosphoacceptor domain -containing protein [Yoonia sp. 208BN28-4]|uniref:histidine kinase dimerization/phosphoacceptor domain -containing protein n=1 Tax=Yoonia sp. 208BN28-4 TaxID=3126505 RepID=UPI0030AEF0AC